MLIIIPFELKEEDYDELMNSLKKGRAFFREVRRAEVLLFLHNQFKTIDIVHAIRVSQPTISRIRHHYLKHGPLYDDKRSGSLRKFSATDRAKITALACSRPSEGREEIGDMTVIIKAVQFLCL